MRDLTTDLGVSCVLEGQGIFKAVDWQREYRIEESLNHRCGSHRLFSQKFSLVRSCLVCLRQKLPPILLSFSLVLNLFNPVQKFEKSPIHGKYM